MITTDILCETVEGYLQEKYPEIKRFGIYFEASNNSLFLSDMYIQPQYRGKGIGTHVMNHVVQFADEVNLPIVLIPEPEDDMMTMKQLVTFYKKFGFVINSGKKMDYSLSIPFATTMIRYPKKD